MPLDRTVFNASFDDDGSGTTGTIEDKAWFDAAIFDPIDAALAAGATPGITTNGAQVTGITFPAIQVPSANVNTLDDYEEGNCTLSIGGSGGQSGQTHSLQTAYYIKIGRFVWVSGIVGLTTLGTITGSVQIKGLPFLCTAGVHNEMFPACVSWYGLATGMVAMIGAIVHTTTVVTLYGATAASIQLQTQTVTQANLGSNAAFSLSAGYLASA